MKRMNEDVLTPRQAADLVGVSRATLYRWINDGRLPAQTVAGTRIRVRREDVEALFRDVEPKQRQRLKIVVKDPRRGHARRKQRTREILEQAGLM